MRLSHCLPDIQRPFVSLPSLPKPVSVLLDQVGGVQVASLSALYKGSLTVHFLFFFFVPIAIEKIKGAWPLSEPPLVH